MGGRQRRPCALRPVHRGVFARPARCPDLLPLPTVYSLGRDRNGAIWTGTAGLFRYDPETRAVVHYPNDPTTPGAIGDRWVLSIAEDDTGTLWIGTNGSGLYRYDPSSDTLARFAYDPSNSESLRDNNVLGLFQSRDGVLWVGTIGVAILQRYRLPPDAEGAIGGLTTCATDATAGVPPAH